MRKILKTEVSFRMLVNALKYSCFLTSQFQYFLEENRTMQKLMGLVRRCVDDYNMIEAGDKIAVGVSGGKDSLVLLVLLAGLKEYFNKPFELEAITIDMGRGMDYSPIEKLCEEINVPYTIVKTEIAPIIFDHRKEKNPCSMCAKMRRGALNQAILDRGFNKLALGHHYDDAVETFVQNRLIQRTTSHLGTHGAGILLLAVLKDNGRNLSLDDGIGHFPLITKRLYGTVIHPKTHVDGHGFQFEGFVEIFFQCCQQNHQNKTVFAAGNTDGDLIAFFDHIVIIHTAADKSCHLLHCLISSGKYIKIACEHSRAFESIYEYFKVYLGFQKIL